MHINRAIPGGTFRIRDDRWWAFVNHNAHRTTLGYFKTEEEALEARRQWARENPNWRVERREVSRQIGWDRFLDWHGVCTPDGLAYEPSWTRERLIAGLKRFVKRNGYVPAWDD
jgi:hypothetical protein